MINKIIAEYLKSSPRIVIPEVGTFIRRKENNEIVFMEVLKRDDGVLKSLIQNTMGLSATEASALVDRYVVEMHNALSTDKKYIVDSVGVLFQNASGSIDFTFNPFARSIPAPEQHISILKLGDEKPEAPKPTTPKPVAETDSARPKPSLETQIVKAKEPASAAKPEENEETEEDENGNSVSNFIERIKRQREQPADEEQERKINIRTNRKRIKLDPITVLAIIAAALAVGSLIWGAIPSRGELEIDTATEEVVSAEEGK